jgi:hypothetical protein
MPRASGLSQASTSGTPLPLNVLVTVIVQGVPCFVEVRSPHVRPRSKYSRDSMAAQAALAAFERLTEEAKKP